MGTTTRTLLYEAYGVKQAQADGIPNPFWSDRTFARFHHADVGHLTDVELWAEQVTTEADLARRIASRRRPRIVHVRSNGALVDDLSWLTERVRALRAEKAQRRRRVA